MKKNFNMKKLILFLCFFTTGLYAQDVPNLLFANKEQCQDYGGDITTVATAKDMFGNIHVVGTFSNKADFDPSAATADLTAIGSSNMFLARYDSNGIYIGAINIGGTGTVTPTAITIDQDFVYVAGNYTKTIDFDPSSNVANLTSTNDLGSGFLAIYNLEGILLEYKSLGGTGTIQMAEMKTYNNQLLIVGNFTGAINFDPSSSAFDLAATATGDSFIAKYNSLLTGIAVFDITSTANVIASSLSVDNAGNIVITGTFSGTTDFDPFSTSNLTVATNRNTFIAKYSNVGVLQWVKDIGGRQATSSSFVPKLVQDSNNNILITGIYSLTSDFNPAAAIVNLTTTGSNIFLAKYDVDGNYIWVKKIGNSPTVLKRNIAIDTSNNVYIDGTFSGITDFDPNAGVVNLDSTSGNFFFAQYDTNGNFVYANNIVATISTLLINNNELVVSGTFTGNLDFDPSSATAILISPAVNAFLSKYNASGSYVYAKQIGNKKSNRIVSYVATDQTGAIYRVGQLSATSDIDPSSAVFSVTNTSLGTGFFISKYTGSGALVWGKTITTAAGSSAGISVTNTDSNGNTYVVGGFTGTVDFDPSANTANMISSSTTATDLYIAKYDSNGNYVWSKQIIGTIGARRKLVFDTSGNFYFTGTYTGTTPIDVDPSIANVFNLTTNGQFNTYIIKFNSQGEFIWAKSILAQPTNGYFVSVTQFDIKDNSIYMTGRMWGGADFNPSPTETNILTTIIQASNETFFAKYDLDGNYQMAFKFDNDPTGLINKGSSFAIDDNGDIYLLAIFINTVDFNPSPTEVFNLTSVPDDSTFNLAILKYTVNGSFVWAKQVRAMDVDSFLPVTSIQGNEWLSSTYIKNNELIVVSSIFGNFDFDPSANDVILPSSIDASGNFNSSFFIAKYNTTSGELINVNKLDGDYVGELYNSCLDINQNLVLSGSFRGTVDFDFTTGVQTVTSASPYNNDRFWAKYTIETLGVQTNNSVNGYNIYPNPTNSILYVSHESFTEFNVTLMDITGKILQKTVLTNQKGVDVSAYPKGIYFIQIENGSEKSTSKFIKD